MDRFAGETGFPAFFATVVNIDDPDKLGQVQIRVDNLHDQFPDEDLPWAMPLLPITSASFQTPEYGEVGTSPTGIMVGSFVYGFFADGVTTRVPFIIGTFPGIKGGDINSHDVPKLARGINTWNSKPLLGPEPESTYGSRYPFNKVTRTISGHTIEIDDTPSAERIHIYHKSGTYVEISPDGRVVTKVMGDNYHIVAGKEEIYVQGNVTVNVKGNVELNVEGALYADVKGEMNFTSSGEMSFDAPKINLKNAYVTDSSSGLLDGS